MRKLTNRYFVQGNTVPNLSIHNVFVEFYRLKSTLNKDVSQNNYVIIRLVTIIEQFCRGILSYKLAQKTTNPNATIQLGLLLMDDLIRTVTEKTKRITKEEIMAASRSFQHTKPINDEFANAFDGLDQNDFEKLFEIRHEIVHSVNEIPSFETKHYFGLIEKMMRNILEKDNNFYQFYRYKIDALKQLNNKREIKKCHKEANDYFKKISNKNKHSEHTLVDIYYTWGLTLETFDKYHEATDCFDKVIQIEPDHWDAHFMRAIAFEKLQDRTMAAKSHDKIIGLDPNDSSGYYNKGLALQDFNEHNEAIKCFEKVIKLDPNRGDAYHGKGISLQKLGNHKKAIACFKKDLKLGSQEGYGYLYNGISLQHIGETAKAKENFIKFLIHISHEDMHPIHVNYDSGIAWQGLGIYDMAIECFSKTLKMDPRHTDALLAMGESLLNIGKNDKAIKYFNKVLKHEPENKRALNGKNIVLG